jgi:hypothetical protein
LGERRDRDVREAHCLISVVFVFSWPLRRYGRRRDVGHRMEGFGFAAICCGLLGRRLVHFG